MTTTLTSTDQLADWKQEVSSKDALETLIWAVSTFGDKIKFASSLGLEDQVITDMIAKSIPSLEIFTLDTGRLFPETYNLIHKIENHYNTKIELYFPDSTEVEEMARNYGVNPFYKSVELRKLCCDIRKLHPLNRALKGMKAWICGLRQEQSGNRQSIEKIEWDTGNNLLKINPLFDWGDEAVWNYIKKHNVPYNVLHDRNYPSIGCFSCTRAINPGEDNRAGRWWWEKEDKKECGLHIVDGKIVRQS